MKTVSLKIAGITASVVVVIAILISVLRSSESDSTQAIKPARASDTKRAADAKIEPNQRAAELFQMALLQKDATDPTGRNYVIMSEYCRQILKRYPDSPEAEKAQELLQEIPQEYQQQYADIQQVEHFPKPEDNFHYRGQLRAMNNSEVERVKKQLEHNRPPLPKKRPPVDAPKKVSADVNE